MGKWGTFMLVGVFISATLGLSYGLWHQPAHSASHPMAANHLAHLPDYVQTADTNVQAAYQFALDSPNLLAQLPCYCGCDKTLHHKNNLDCYITAWKSDGSTAAYTDHAAYCGVCVDTTLLAQKLAGQGQPAKAIHTAIDAQYGYTTPHTHPATVVE